MAKELTAERLRELYEYEHSTGNFIRKTTAGSQKIGAIAGTPSDKRIQISVDAHLYKAHRLAWLYVTGEWPLHDIDHIDGNSMNNRWNNLRDIPHSINQQNRRKPASHNKVGLLGVVRNKKRFGAQIKTAGIWKWLGTYDTPEQAHAVYLEAKRREHIGCTI